MVEIYVRYGTDEIRLRIDVAQLLWVVVQVALLVAASSYHLPMN